MRSVCMSISTKAELSFDIHKKYVWYGTAIVGVLPMM